MSHCAALFSYFGAFYSTFLSQRSHTVPLLLLSSQIRHFFLSFYGFSAHHQQICQHAPHSWKTCISNGCKKKKPKQQLYKAKISFCLSVYTSLITLGEKIQISYPQDIGHHTPWKQITFKLVENHSQKSSPNSSQYQSDTLKFQNLDFFVHPPRVLCLQ